MSLPTAVRIVEVGPRDGLQNESVTLDIATRVELVQAWLMPACKPLKPAVLLAQNGCHKWQVVMKYLNN